MLLTALPHAHRQPDALAQRQKLCSELDAERLATLATSSESAAEQRKELISQLIRAGFDRDPVFNFLLPNPDATAFDTTIETMEALVARSNTIGDTETKEIFERICSEFQAKLRVVGQRRTRGSTT